MRISYVKHINKDENDRIEFLLTNYDYYDGNDLIAQLFVQEYNMESSEKLDGFFYSLIKLYDDTNEYELIWHEDVGNYIFSTKQGNDSIDLLEKRLTNIINLLNNNLKYNNLI